MSSESWNKEKLAELYAMPLLALVFKAQAIHRTYFDPEEIELCTLSNIKTGTCPEDCAYCSQSGHYKTGIQKEKLYNLAEVIEQATLAKANGAIRFCMGAAWRSPSAKDLPKVSEMIKAVKALGLETCVTLGMLDEEQAKELKQAGLDFYNHNLDTSPEYYPQIITTRSYQDRLDTLNCIHKAGIRVCCGGIIGMGESRADRIAFLCQLANLPAPPESVPINRLMAIPGTPLAKTAEIDSLEFIRTIAVARIIMPTSTIRLGAGRITMSEETQALCFLAGANSIFFGDRLLTEPNPANRQDLNLLHKLGLKVKKQKANLHQQPCLSSKPSDITAATCETK